MHSLKFLLVGIVVMGAFIGKSSLGEAAVRLSPQSEVFSKGNDIVRLAEVVRVGHDPRGYTLNHDYYAGRRDKFIAHLISLVDGAHTIRILEYVKAAMKRKKQKWILWNYRRALHECDYVLERLVNHPKALTLCVSVVKFLNRPGYLMKYFENAVRLYPKHAVTHAQYGRYLSEIGEHEDAVARLQRAIMMDEKSKVSHAWLAEAYRKKGEIDLAKQSAKKARDLGYRGKFDSEISP